MVSYRKSAVALLTWQSTQGVYTVYSYTTAGLAGRGTENGNATLQNMSKQKICTYIERTHCSLSSAVVEFHECGKARIKTEVGKCVCACLS